MGILDSKTVKWIYGSFRSVNGQTIYKSFTTEEKAFNEMQKLGYRVISKKKDYCSDHQSVFICFN